MAALIPPKIPKSLTIAGSDSGGGAGIQADLKTFSALKTFGMSAITAITAQNTKEVLQILELPVDIINNQIKAVAEDIGVDAFKTGMLSSEKIIHAVAASIRDFGLKNYVLDPVMTSKSGHTLLKPEAIHALITELLPLSLIITPNIPEAQILAGMEINNDGAVRDALKKILDLGPKNVIIKGGHAQGNPVDWINLAGYIFAIPESRIDTRNTHGSGCTFAAAIVSFLARGYELDKAIWEAKSYIHKAIARSLDIGAGHGPLHHFHPWYRF
jgi:hydroxymethylpyrimidine/phosphomethylpyrimidine kinase